MFFALWRSRYEAPKTLPLVLGIGLGKNEYSLGA
jgi:hypothetical protein